mgnify:CR=1 FL=1
MRPIVVKAVLFGAASLVLYTLLFLSADYFVAWAAHTRKAATFAEKGFYFLIPLGVAFAFSYFHGNFTGYFWEALGLKAVDNTKTKAKKT